MYSYHTLLYYMKMDFFSVLYVNSILLMNFSPSYIFTISARI
nr:V-type Ig domain protein [Oriental turtle dovepox virus]